MNELKTDWKINYINNIPENGISCWWTFAELDGLKRFYKIVPYHECDVNGLVLSKEPKYFAFYESIGWDEIDVNNKDNRYLENYDGIIPINPSLIAIYEDLETAKKRVETQLKAIVNIRKAYFPHDEQ